MDREETNVPPSTKNRDSLTLYVSLGQTTTGQEHNQMLEDGQYVTRIGKDDNEDKLCPVTPLTGTTVRRIVR